MLDLRRGAHGRHWCRRRRPGARHRRRRAGAQPRRWCARCRVSRRADACRTRGPRIPWPRCARPGARATQCSWRWDAAARGPVGVASCKPRPRHRSWSRCGIGGTAGQPSAPAARSLDRAESPGPVRYPRGVKPITEVAASLDVAPEHVLPYGHDKAKILTAARQAPRHSTDPAKLVLVSALTPTPAGEGKTTTTIGLGDALSRKGQRVCLALREPSLGPCFGIKGGGTGGGVSRLQPTDDINLHFTGDFHAITAAHNLLAARSGSTRLASYDGYGSCPLTVERGKIVLAEFGYGGKLAPTFPKWLIDGEQPSRLAW
ncbi:MAG: formate--tetrahydrofolate ligase, partial [Deltaproteobacteria bacterium]|nr:formate--tetrahydrofolate ligase [Deltaproteobacteria bacterium]